PWLDWFKVEGWPLSAYDGSRTANYRGWWNNRALPEFNHDHPDVREYIMRIAEYWLEQGIDGWRLDVPFEVKTPGFWQEFRQRVKAINPEAYIVGEIWRDARQWLDGEQFDGVMNYIFTGATLAFAGQGHIQKDLVDAPAYDAYPAIDAAEYGRQIQELLELYPWDIQLAQLNLLSSHDTARVRSILGHDRASIKLAVLLLLTFPGAPSIYYGDEVGLPGRLDPDCRWSFPTRSRWDLDLLNYHRDLIALRHRYAALQTGDYRTVFTDGLVYGFERKLGQMAVRVYANGGSDPTTVPLAPDQWDIRFGNGHLHQGLQLPPREGCVVVAQDKT
ncbi:MAG: DUF3459 domain-containing protein, partial [Spirulina sp. SIO3F2]|nr:DUF3459 domain-containing protein [Spirulina sp. SIO3F2]